MKYFVVIFLLINLVSCVQNKRQIKNPRAEVSERTEKVKFFKIKNEAFEFDMEISVDNIVIQINKKSTYSTCIDLAKKRYWVVGFDEVCESILINEILTKELWTNLYVYGVITSLIENSQIQFYDHDKRINVIKREFFGSSEDSGPFRASMFEYSVNDIVIYNHLFGFID